MKNIELYKKELKKTNKIKWISLVIFLSFFILTFVLSLNGIILFPFVEYVLSIIWLCGLILFIYERKKQKKLEEYIFNQNKLIDAIEDSEISIKNK